MQKLRGDDPRDWAALDSETEPTTPYNLAPPLACLSYSDGVHTALFDSERAPMAFLEIVDSGQGIVGHRLPYDMAVMKRREPLLTQLIFNLYEEGRIRDTKQRAKLQMIKTGEIEDKVRRGQTGLADLAREIGLTLEKGDDSWQMRFGELINVPIEQWPKGAVAYASTDPLATHRVFEAQGDVSPDEDLQARAGFALHLMGVHGVRADPEAVEKLDKEITVGLAVHEKALSQMGLNWQQYDKKTGKPKGKPIDGILAWERKPKKGDEPAHWDWTLKTEVMQVLVELAYEARGIVPPRTGPSKRFPNGQIKTDKDTRELSSDPYLAKVNEREAWKKQKDFLKVLKKASGGQRWCPSWNDLMATGRTSCGSDDDPGNLQNQPRKHGIRECFIPDPGMAYISCDYDTAELCGWAQVCYSWFGRSELRECFLRDGDPHVEMAADLYGIAREAAYQLHAAEDEAFGEKRQFAKIPNFGLPGGLGKVSFASYSWSFGRVKIGVNERIDGRPSAVEAIAAWRERWPESRDYFAVFAEICGDLGPHAVEQLFSGRVRGGLRYTSGCNTMFQGLVADAAKDALWEVTRRCYAVPSSKLYGCRPVFFVHDEIIIEAPIEGVHEAAMELQEVMESIGQKWMPDVPVKASAKAMMRWFKKAKRVTDKHGRVIPWTPEKKAA